MRMISDRIDALVADKGYDSDAVRDILTSMDVEAVIPARRNRRSPAAHDQVKYRWRNQVERLFNKLKNWRRGATQYDKTAECYIAFVSLASVLPRMLLFTMLKKLLLAPYERFQLACRQTDIHSNTRLEAYRNYKR